MALVHEDGTGKTDAESYCSVTFADARHTAFGNSTWTGADAVKEAALRKAIQLKPGWGDAHYLLAVLYATQQPNYKELAQYHYKKAIAGGAGRNLELEKWMEKPSSGARPQ